MRLRQFRYFISIVENGGFTKAAARLFVAQSALSLQMKKLEEEFETPLFLRNSNGVTLTPAGEAFLRHARLVTAQITACKREIRDIAEEPMLGVVRIGIAVSLSRVLTIPLLRTLQKLHPGISLNVIEALTSDMEYGLQEGTLDLAIGFGWAGTASAAGARDAGQDADVLRFEDLYLVSPIDGHRAGPAIDLADVGRFELVLPTARYATRRFLIEEAARRGIALPVRFELDSLPQTLSMIIEGEAHSIMSMPTFLDEWRANRVCARPISGLSRKPRLYLRSSKSAPNWAVDTVRQLVRQTARELTENGTWPLTLQENTDNQVSDKGVLAG